MKLNNYGNIVLGLHLGKTVSMWKSLLVSLQHNAEFTRTHRPMFSGCPLQKLHYNALTICALAMSATTRSLKDNLNQAGLQVYQTCSPSQWIQSNFLYPFPPLDACQKIHQHFTVLAISSYIFSPSQKTGQWHFAEMTRDDSRFGDSVLPLVTRLLALWESSGKACHSATWATVATQSYGRWVCFIPDCKHTTARVPAGLPYNYISS